MAGGGVSVCWSCVLDGSRQANKLSCRREQSGDELAKLSRDDLDARRLMTGTKKYFEEFLALSSRMRPPFVSFLPLATRAFYTWSLARFRVGVLSAVNACIIFQYLYNARTVRWK